MTSDGQADISVVICAYTEKRWDDLVACVASVCQQTVAPFEVIVVIDHNPQLLRRFRDHMPTAIMPSVIVLQNEGEPGASASRNTGVKAARGSIVAFLDDDAEASPDWIEQIIWGFADPDVLGVGGFLQPVWLNGRPGWFPEEFNWVIGCSYRGLPEAAAPVRNLIGANMSVRRGVFESIGGFRGGFGNIKSGGASGTSFLKSVAGDEETELCIRALQRWPNGKWLYEPKARVRHQVPGSRASLRYFLSRCYDEGLGKASLSRLVGPGPGLSSERHYVANTLPKGVLRGLGSTIQNYDLAGIQQSAAIIAGLSATVAGYIVGSSSHWIASLIHRRGEEARPRTAIP